MTLTTSYRISSPLVKVYVGDDKMIKKISHMKIKSLRNLKKYY